MDEDDVARVVKRVVRSAAERIWPFETERWGVGKTTARVKNDRSAVTVGKLVPGVPVSENVTSVESMSPVLVIVLVYVIVSVVLSYSRGATLS